jgi:hypothetical protein
MVFAPDILVTSADGFEVILVAETKLHEKDIPKAESQLKAYMLGMRVPIGLLVTPASLRIYRDRYITPPEKSIELIGEFDVAQLFGSYAGQAGPNTAMRFESDVQTWLESLASKPLEDCLPSKLQHVAELNIQPALSEGIIRAGHPRFVLSA